jgi:hypothetical protein
MRTAAAPEAPAEPFADADEDDSCAKQEPHSYQEPRAYQDSHAYRYPDSEQDRNAHRHTDPNQ